MKTNILKKLVLVPAAVLAMTGCNESDFLSFTNPNEYVEDTYWSSEANAQAAMATI